MKKGGIYIGKNRSREAAKHPIVFLSRLPGKDFVGAVLTHSSHPDNVLTSPEHFKDVDDKGDRFKFRYSKTYFVVNKFIKPDEWGPYTKVGELSPNGLAFISEKIAGKDPVMWKKYVGE